MSSHRPTPLIIDYYSDVLCVWSWIAQRRNDELKKQWGDQVVLRQHFLNLFGSYERRMTQQWAARGGAAGFADYVHASVKPFDNAPVHPELWRSVKPNSSLNAHLLIKASELHYGCTASEQFTRAIRDAFYTHAQNIGQQSLLLDIAHQQSLDKAPLLDALESGAAAASLMSDYQKAQENNIKGSPSWVLDGGRQVLYGNVGYRVLHANIDELLRTPTGEASWC
jgi:predicted DsbA family dithiol-disulfide isomerase